MPISPVFDKPINGYRGGAFPTGQFGAVSRRSAFGTRSAVSAVPASCHQAKFASQDDLARAPDIVVELRLPHLDDVLRHLD